MIKTGIKDSYGREINYMRISITDRCNLRCRYCMPDGAEWIPMKEILTYEEITEVCQEAVKLGITRFKITGGEPLVRRGCPEVIRMIKNIPGTELVTLTTNGLLLGEQLEALLSAGLDAVNISLDTLDIKKYEWITGFDKLAVVLSSIEKAVASGIPVKINAVLQKGMNEEEWLPLTELARKLPLSVRFIEMMPIGLGKAYQGSMQEVIQKNLENIYGAAKPDSGAVRGNGPAVYWEFPGFQGKIGFISAISHKFCKDCNRIRMTAEGFVKPCLQFAQGVDMRSLLRGQTDDEELKQVFEQLIYEKPRCHQFETEKADESLEQREMSKIGG